MTRRLLSLFLFLITCASLAAPQETASPQRVRVSDDVMRGVLVKKVDPVYPPLARQARIQGTVVLKALINTSGDVYNLQLVSGHPMLAPAAVEAVKQWKYKPYLLNGEAVEVETTVQVIFKLEDEPAPAGANAPGGAAGGVPGGVPGAQFPGRIVGGVIGGIVSSTPAPGSGSSGVVRISEAVMRSLRIQKVIPDYPPAALTERISGPVLLAVEISPLGDVEFIRLISGHPRLVPAAIGAVKLWKYKPYLLNGEPVRVGTIVSLSFGLADQNGLKGVVSEPPPSETMPPSTTVPQRVRVSSGVQSQLLQTRVNPKYPPDAREQHIQGVVVLKVDIDKDGNVSNVELISGHPALAQAAIDAVRQWKYKPYLLNGTPVEVETQVQVNFTLQP